jgi:hypothetical protein
MKSSRWTLDLPLTALLLVLLLLISDFTDNWWRGNISRMTWLVLDTSLQTLISVMVAAPLLNHPLFRRRLLPWFVALVAVIVALDLDHFVAAGSFRFEDALSLAYRPVSHSLGFALLVGLAGWAITRQALAGLLFTIGLSTHVLHDVQNSGASFFLAIVERDHLPAFCTVYHPEPGAALYGSGTLPQRQTAAPSGAAVSIKYFITASSS